MRQEVIFENRTYIRNKDLLLLQGEIIIWEK